MRQYILILLLCLCSSVVYAGSTTLVTYYPAPVGSYNRIQLKTQADACSTLAATYNEIFIDSTGSLKLCTSSTSTVFSNVWLTTGTNGDAYIDTIGTNTDPKVGLNTATPRYPLDLGLSTGEKLAIYSDGVASGVFYGLGSDGSSLQLYGNTASAGLIVKDAGVDIVLPASGTFNVGTSNELTIDTTGVITAPNGTTELPAYSFKDDATTGLRKTPSTEPRVPNALSFVTNEITRMIIDSSGNVGIGVQTAGADIADPIHAPLQVHPNDDLSGAAGSLGASVESIRSTGLSGYGSFIYFTNFDTADAIGSREHYVSGIEGYDFAGTKTGGGGLALLTSAAASPTIAPVRRLVITPTGNVGIGTDHPNNTLQVNGLILANTPASTDSDNAVATKEYVDSHNGGCFMRYCSTTEVETGTADNVYNSGSCAYNYVDGTPVANDGCEADGYTRTFPIPDVTKSAPYDCASGTGTICETRTYSTACCQN